MSSRRAEPPQLRARPRRCLPSSAARRLIAKRNACDRVSWISQVTKSAREVFDVVVVGAGSSGGVIASRLAESDVFRVLLLEAGPDFPDENVLLPLFAASGSSNWLPLGVPE